MKDRVQTTIRLPSELLNRLRREADRRGKSLNCLIRNILMRFLKDYPVE